MDEKEKRKQRLLQSKESRLKFIIGAESTLPEPPAANNAVSNSFSPPPPNPQNNTTGNEPQTTPSIPPTTAHVSETEPRPTIQKISTPTEPLQIPPPARATAQDLGLAIAPPRTKVDRSAHDDGDDDDADDDDDDDDDANHGGGNDDDNDDESTDTEPFQAPSWFVQSRPVLHRVSVVGRTMLTICAFCYFGSPYVPTNFAFPKASIRVAVLRLANSIVFTFVAAVVAAVAYFKFQKQPSSGSSQLHNTWVKQSVTTRVGQFDLWLFPVVWASSLLLCPDLTHLSVVFAIVFEQVVLHLALNLALLMGGYQVSLSLLPSIHDVAIGAVLALFKVVLVFVALVFVSEIKHIYITATTPTIAASKN